MKKVTKKTKKKKAKSNKFKSNSEPALRDLQCSLADILSDLKEQTASGEMYIRGERIDLCPLAKAALLEVIESIAEARQKSSFIEYPFLLNLFTRE